MISCPQKTLQRSKLWFKIFLFHSKYSILMVLLKSSRRT